MEHAFCKKKKNYILHGNRHDHSNSATDLVPLVSTNCLKEAKTQYTIQFFSDKINFSAWLFTHYESRLNCPRTSNKLHAQKKL